MWIVEQSLMELVHCWEHDPEPTDYELMHLVRRASRRGNGKNVVGNAKKRRNFCSGERKVIYGSESELADVHNIFSRM